MAKLFFFYGVMSSGKSMELLKVAYNYEAQNRDILLLTSALDDRYKIGTITSRVGIKREAKVIYKDTNIIHVLEKEKKISAILIDEAQFLSTEQIRQLTKIVDEYNITVLTFGLKNDAFNNLFEGSKELLINADKITEMKTLCSFCEKKALMNLRIHNNKPVYSGDQIEIGGNESYLPVCRKHYKNPVIKEG